MEITRTGGNGLPSSCCVSSMFRCVCVCVNANCICVGRRELVRTQEKGVGVVHDVLIEYIIYYCLNLQLCSWPEAGSRGGQGKRRKGRSLQQSRTPGLSICYNVSCLFPFSFSFRVLSTRKNKSRSPSPAPQIPYGKEDRGGGIRPHAFRARAYTRPTSLSSTLYCG